MINSKSVSSKIVWYGLLGGVFFMPLSQFISSRLLIFLCIWSTMSLFSKAYFKEVLSSSFDLVAYFLVLVVGLVFLDNVLVGFAELETNLCLLAFPVIFNRTGPVTDQKVHQLLSVFALGLALACCIYISGGLLATVQTGIWSFKTFFTALSILNFDPTYIAYYLVVGIAHQLYVLYYRKTNISIVFHGLIICLFFGILVVSDTSPAAVALLLIFAFFILKFVLEKGERTKWITVTLVVLLTVFLFVGKSARGPRADEFVNDSWERFALWKATLRAIPNYWVGVGTGRQREVLKDYFLSHDMEKFALKEYNAHNQFIMAIMSNGIMGLFTLLLLFFRPLYLAATRQSMLPVLLFFPFIVFATTEVIFGRYQGVALVGFIHQISVLAAANKNL